MRLDKYAASAASGRREIKKLINKGSVCVNGKIVKDASFAVKDGDIVEVLGERVIYREFVYIMMNKPAGVLSATYDPKHKTVTDLLSEELRRFEPFPVGRLDIDTTGLLLLTNDGAAAHALLSPRKKVPKKYIAETDGQITDDDIKKFADGILLDDGYKTMPAKLRVLNNERTVAEVTVCEGKFHQVKRMFADTGKHVLKLERKEFAGLSLDKTLERGGYRELLPEELENLGKIMQCY